MKSINLETFASILLLIGLSAFLPLHHAQGELQRDMAWDSLLARSKPPELTDWGARFEHGEGIERDYGRAVLLYCMAARQGHERAQFALGWMFAVGRGVSRDDTMAHAWFGLAAKRGMPQAKRMLLLTRAKSEPVRPLCLDTETQQQSLWASQWRNRVRGWVVPLAPAYGLNADLVLAVIQTESNFDATARSPKNAIGLMQLMPATARRFGVSNAIDPVQNIHAGMAYLSWLLDHYDQDLKLALAAYNAGEAAVDSHQGIPPYAETLNYVEKVMYRYARAVEARKVLSSSQSM